MCVEVYVCIGVGCACVHVGAHVCEYQWSTLSIPFVSTLFFETGSFTKSEAHKFALDNCPRSSKALLVSTPHPLRMFQMGATLLSIHMGAGLMTEVLLIAQPAPWDIYFYL